MVQNFLTLNLSSSSYIEKIVFHATVVLGMLCMCLVLHADRRVLYLNEYLELWDALSRSLPCIMREVSSTRQRCMKMNRFIRLRKKHGA